MVQLWFEKEAASEDFILLLLENMTARINWLPYRKDIRVSSMAIFLDYGNIRGSYGPLTKLMGFYRPVKYTVHIQPLRTHFWKLLSLIDFKSYFNWRWNVYSQVEQFY